MEESVMCKIAGGKFGDYVGKTACFSCVWRTQCIQASVESNKKRSCVKEEPFYSGLYEKIRGYAYKEGCSMFKEDPENGSRYETPLFFQRKDTIRIIGATKDEIWIQHRKGQEVDFVVIPNEN